MASSSAAMDMRAKLDARMNELEGLRYSWWLHWAEVARFFIPRRYRWLVTSNQAYRGVPINQSIIDNTGTLALRTLAAGLMSGLTSPDRPWFSLTLNDQDLAQYNPVKLWLDEVRRRLMRIFAESNFYLGMSVLYEDLAAFGTASMIIYEDAADIVRCYNPCAGEYFLSQSDRLQVDTLYRKLTMTARQMAQKFPVDQMPPDAQALMRTGGGAQDRELIVGHAIEPAEAGSKGLPFREVYWVLGSSNDQVLSQGGFHEFPAICPRWYLAGNDVYGRSPCMDALGDQKQLQVEQKRKGQAIDKQVNPPLLMDNALKNEPASMLPGGVTYVASTGQVGGAKPVYEVKPDLAAMREDIGEVQGRIKQMLYYDLFLMISQLDTVRTATEIIERKQEKLLMLSPMLERMFVEGLDPAVRRVARIAARFGLFPPMPQELRGRAIEIQYTSMLAQAQRSVETQGLERMAAMFGNLAGANPEVLDKFNMDKYVDVYNDALGNTPQIIRSDDEAQAMRQQRAQQQQAAQAMNAASAAVQGAQTLSETPIGRGSALDAVMGNA